MQALREFFNSNAGKATAIILILVGVVAMFMSVRSNLSSDIAAISRDRMFIDAKTLKPYEHVLSMGEKMPVKAPSGGNTGYPAELCYWTKDGTIRKDPYPVLLNQAIGK